MQVGDRSKAKPECALGGKTNSNAATEVHRMLTIDHLQQHARALNVTSTRASRDQLNVFVKQL